MNQPLQFYKDLEPDLFPEEILRRCRIRAGLSQEELANLVGLTSSRMIQSWEGGFALPKPARLRILIEVFYKQRAFGSGQELEEARRLWLNIKNFYESNSEKLLSYPHFDPNWFEKDVLKAGNEPTTAPLPLPVAPVKVSSSLPLSAHSIIGRETELDEVTDLLLFQKERLVTLTGAGGSGKTRLALEVVTRLGPSNFKDGIFFAALETLNSTSLLIPQLASTLEIAQPDSTSLLEVVKGFLSKRQLLLVLDNFEQLLPAASVMAELLQVAPGLQMLITSREPLRIKYEREYGVAPLRLPVFSDEKPELENLAANPAVAFFCQRASLANLDFTFNQANAEAIAQICQKLDGLPLAIELAAGRANLLTPAQILARLDNRFKLLASSSLAFSSRHRTLHGALEWSYDLLEPAEKSLFARLAVFAGSFSVESAESLCGDNTSEVLDGLDSLINKNLVHRVRNPEGPIRCQMLQTIRDYALEKLAWMGPGEETRLYGRFETYYLELVESSEPHFRGSEQGAILDALEQEFPNIREVIQRFFLKDNAMAALRIGGALWYFCWVRGYVGEGRTYLEKALALPLSDEAARAKALNAVGNLADIQGDIDLSLHYFTNCLEAYRKLADERGMSIALNNMGNVTSIKGDYQAAKNYLEQSLELRKHAGDQKGVADSLNNLGRLARLMGDPAAGLEYYKATLVLGRQLKYWSIVAQVLSNLANLTLNLDDLEAAKHYAQESYNLAQEMNNKAMTVFSLVSLGQIAFESADYPAALTHYQDGLELSQQLEDRLQIGSCLDGLGRVFTEISHLDDAARYLEKSRGHFEVVGSRQGILNGLLSQASLIARQGNLQEAAALLNKLNLLQIEWHTYLEALDRRYYQKIREICGQ